MSLPWNHEYKGYRIHTNCPGQTWSARIMPPSSTRILSDIPTATREEGENVLLDRARAAIDADIAKVQGA